jgi:hypothetical protein
MMSSQGYYRVSFTFYTLAPAHLPDGTAAVGVVAYCFVVKPEVVVVTEVAVDGAPTWPALPTVELYRSATGPPHQWEEPFARGA